ncbi:terpene cyclase/mutase family protein [Actinoallomurus purpureus]|uniref:prenyltransferase/squalene oxidase repeat-containing protein n=1 Tax=Actinoallomurus purpureus TaxID=478114 RepID=UPI002092ADB2|nr:prenyltransferase/squalene oxidase repeat-containing protein [Actinoallomurus purpureus]MCO6010815.1 terpene cyclase/mutase family protein [Actinoallomurus purpureus]
MLEEVCAAQGVALGQIVRDSLAYFQRCRLPDGSIAEDPGTLIFQEWDSVNALKATALWRDAVSFDDAGLVEGVLAFLRAREKPSGMLSWGVKETGPAEYCTETSSEYIASLTLLGHLDDARRKAAFLRSRQLPSGPWEEVHSHIPRAFQAEPSVTGFALMALLGLDIEPLYLDEALDFLAKAQKDGGHFGINWYYYNSHYYLIRPAVAALASYGYHAVAGAARDFVLARQRHDGSWHSEVEGFGDFSSPEQHTALALRTLADAGMTTGDPAVRRGVTWLLGRRRPDGSWFGGRYPFPDTSAYREFDAAQDVFTTSQVLSALKQLADPEA